MLFNSYEFIFLFLPAVLAGFFVIARRNPRVAVTWLVAASLFFYAWWNPPFVLLILVSIVFNYAIGSLISSRRGTPARTGHGFPLVLGVSGNLALLGYYKYSHFFLDTLNQVARTSWHLDDIVLPIGISFFTFQQIAYLVDTHQGRTDEHNLIHYCLFVCFFPQLIAGPIVHHSEMLGQFRRVSTFIPRADNFAIGTAIFVAGLAKKVLLADQFARIATPAFAAAEGPADLHFFQAWDGAIAYALQLYFDFSGYSDMAIGLARLFGILLPLNFDSPYKATSVVDFWRRWHITLSRFLKDYLYVPLGGNRRGRCRRYLNLFLTMLLGGLWHGASWTFVCWGGLHGVGLSINHAWRFLKRRPVNRWWSRLLARAATFLFVVVTWVFFRAETFGGALAVLQGMVNLPFTMGPRLGPLAGLVQGLGVRFEGPFVHTEDLQLTLYLGAWVAFVWLAPNTQELMGDVGPAHAYLPRTGAPWHKSGWLSRLSWRPSIAWAAVFGLLFSVCVLSLSQISEFIYYRF